jgi:uncharacterized membrane protein YfhO
MQSSTYEPKKTAYITRAEAEKTGLEIGASGAVSDNASSRGTVTITGYTPNRVMLHAATDTPALLILSDTFYPGWKAFDNGREIPVLRVNHTLRGISLGPGDHTVSFVFRPVSLMIGAGLSLLTIAGVVIIVVLKKRRHRGP